MSELTRQSATEMAEKVRRKQVSPLELVEAHLARIERLNPKLNAFIPLDAERAVASARQAEGALRAGIPGGKQQAQDPL